MRNKEIKIAMIEVGIKQYELAELLGLSETVLCRKLRKELPKEEKEKIIKLIKESRG